MRRPARALVLGLALVLGATASMGATLADPIEEPPILEELVEGHVVFATIDAYQRALGPAPAAAPAPATAAAPLVPEPEEVLLYIEREPGVLWFNDQYLVEPDVSTLTGLGAGTNMSTTYGSAMAVLVRADSDEGLREPCGGAVMAWPAGWGDARWLFGETLPPELATVESYTPGEALNDPVYVESYRVVDPNGRAFVTDLYATWVQAENGAIVPFPISVTNVLGGEVFVPDSETPRVGGLTTGDCAFLDVRPNGVEPLTPARIDPHDETCGLPSPLALPHLFEDDPCSSYVEPSRNGFCFAGPAVDGTLGCERSADRPLRRYQAVMYFAWEFLPGGGSAADHCNPGWWAAADAWGPLACDPAASPSTNGCQTGTEWPCPWEEPWQTEFSTDLYEGDSHPFGRADAFTAFYSDCPRAGDLSPVNHGGSLNRTWGECDYFHETTAMEVLYLGDRRPPTPAVRWFRVDDALGSDAGWFDHACAYEDPLAC